MSRFWLDANVLIEAHNRSYPIDVAVTFWGRIAEQIEKGNLVCPKRVYKELAEHEKHQDKVAEFVKTRRTRGLCIYPSRGVQDAVGKIEGYIFDRYTWESAWHFSKGGDPWVIAHAIDESGTVVTYESALHPDSQKARIPDVCKHFGVDCINLNEMARRLKVTW